MGIRYWICALFLEQYDETVTITTELPKDTFIQIEGRFKLRTAVLHLDKGYYWKRVDNTMDKSNETD